MALDELARVLLDELLLRVDALQVLQRDAMHVPDRLDRALPFRLRQRNAIDALQSVGGGSRRQQPLEPREQRFGALDEFVRVVSRMRRDLARRRATASSRPGSSSATPAISSGIPR